jgi:hypothetical protein
MADAIPKAKLKSPYIDRLNPKFAGNPQREADARGIRRGRWQPNRDRLPSSLFCALRSALRSFVFSREFLWMSYSSSCCSDS